MADFSSETIFVVGAGAHGRVLVDVIKDTHHDRKIVFLDDRQELWGKYINGVKVGGGVEGFLMSQVFPGVSVVAIGHNCTRLSILERFMKAKAPIISIIHKSAVIFETASIGFGSMINPQVFVGSNAVVGHGVLLNTGAVIEHDCVVEEGAAISSGCKIGGRVVIGKGAFVCIGATLCPRVKIGDGAIIGGGSLVVNDIPCGALAYGSPARVVRPVSEQDWRKVL